MAEAKKFVLKVDLNNERDKKKAMRVTSTVEGIESISMDMKDKKLTVVGTLDPIQVVTKLRKCWFVEIVSVGPAKEPKKEEPKKEEPKKDDEKKSKEEQIEELVKAYKAYNPYIYYHAQSVEENPNACVIV